MKRPADARTVSGRRRVIFTLVILHLFFHFLSFLGNSFTCYTFQKVYCQNLVTEIIIIWCHKGHWYLFLCATYLKIFFHYKANLHKMVTIYWAGLRITAMLLFVLCTWAVKFTPTNAYRDQHSGRELKWRLFCHEWATNTDDAKKTKQNPALFCKQVVITASNTLPITKACRATLPPSCN